MANEVQAWSPFRDMENFRKEFDRLFDRMGVGRWMPFFGSESATLALESFVEGDKMIVRADLPGIDPKSVEITVSGNILTLRGKRERREGEKDINFIHREVGYGTFERSMSLPAGVKSEDIKANYDKGVLELTIPMPKEAVPRKIPIEINGEAKK